MEELLSFLGQMESQGGTPNELSRRRKENLIRDILGISSSIYKSIDGNKRIRDLKESGARLKKPNSPSKRFKSKAIQEALDRARKLANNPLSKSELGAINNAELDQYFQDRAIARTASTGSASSYGTLMQGAANRRLRNNQSKLSNIAAQRRETERNFGSIAGMSANEDASIFSDNMSLYNTNLDQYNRESSAIGRSLASARLSRLGAIDSLIDPLSRLGSRADFRNINRDIEINRHQFKPPGFYGADEVDPYSYDYDNFGEGMNDYHEYINNVNTGSAFDPYNYNSTPRSRRFFNS